MSRSVSRLSTRFRPHRFRATFAVRMLEHGVTLDQVSLLLGHSSIRTTQEYYAPWVQTRQRLLDEAVATLDFVSPKPNDTIYETNDNKACNTLKIKGGVWRKPVGVEPTCDTKYRTSGLKPAPSTSQEWLPRAILTDPSRSVSILNSGSRICGKGIANVTLEGSSSINPRSSNGRTAAFGAVNRGSNPCRGATLFVQQLTRTSRNCWTDFVPLTQKRKLLSARQLTRWAWIRKSNQLGLDARCSRRSQRGPNSFEG